MSTRSYHERLWEAIPPGLAPAGLELRREFLRRQLHRIARERSTPASAAPLRVLDVGCGEAQLTGELAQAGFAVVGIDVAEEPLRRAREREGDVLELRCVQPEQTWPLADASFDVVWAGETIEHVADTSGWLSEVRRVLRSGGTLLLSTPAHEPGTRLALGLSRRRFERRLDPRSDHLRFYTRRTLAALLADLGFEQILVHGAGGLPGARHTLLASAVRSRF